MGFPQAAEMGSDVANAEESRTENGEIREQRTGFWRWLAQLQSAKSSRENRDRRERKGREMIFSIESSMEISNIPHSNRNLQLNS